MSYNYTAAMTLYVNDLPDIINMYGENPIFLSIFNKIDKNYIYDNHIAIFKWQYLNNFISTPEYELLKKIAAKFNADLVIINDDDEIIDEEYEIGILYCPSLSLEFRSKSVKFRGFHFYTHNSIFRPKLPVFRWIVKHIA